MQQPRGRTIHDETRRKRSGTIAGAETSGLVANAPIACGLPDMRQRVGNDQAHTDAVARFALFELLSVLRARACALD
jgi:hypothetical protein